MTRVMRITATLVALTLAPPALAQMPQMEFLHLTGDGTGEGADCTASNHQINVGPSNTDGALLARPVTVNVVAITTAGPDRFADRHGGRFLRRADGSLIAPKNSQIKGRATLQISRNQKDPTRLCWADDSLDTGDSQVMVVIANGPGYTVHPERGRLEFTITDNDDCASPAGTPGGVVWKESGCRCATQSTHDSVRQLASPMPRVHVSLRACADGETPGDPPVCSTNPQAPATTRTSTQPESVWRQTLRNLAAHFSDPSYLYCPESPWKGLP